MPNLPTKLYRTKQVRELDRLTIQTAGISGFELMSRAGEVVFQWICRQYPQVRSLAVFCGAGNNAGDGYIVASLAKYAGFLVNVYSCIDPEQLKGDAGSAYKNYVKDKGNVIPFQADQFISADIIVDALFGTGLDRPVSGIYAEAINTINRQEKKVVAIDIPSGLNADTGNIMGLAVKADSTVSFIGLKQGLLTGLAPDYCGEIIYDTLSVPDSVFESVPASAIRIIKNPWPDRNRCSHKGDYGHVLIVGGDRGYSGAARLAGEAALRMGTGLVSVATHREHAGTLNQGRPELMCHGVQYVRDLTMLMEKADVVVLGPGLGQTDWAKVLFACALSCNKKMVIDADALNLLAQSPQNKDNWILTPHPGEAARLLNCTTSDILQNRFSAASAIQNKYGGVTVLKGAGTLIATAHEMAVSTSGNPGMATGGMGDVLSGVIAGLLAQGFSLPHAAQQGVYGHGSAADRAVKKSGERGLLASDLMPYLRTWANE